jgi:hypothetical protein
MVRDDAKFLFCLFGFAGFLFLFLCTVITQENLIMALLNGCIGCLFFSVSGRFLLGFALRGVSVNEHQNDISTPHVSNRNYSNEVKQDDDPVAPKPALTGTPNQNAET